MANSKNTNTKNVPKKDTSKNKKSTNNKTTTKRQTKAEIEREMLLKEQKEANIVRIVGIVLFAISVIFFFVSVVNGEGAWLFVHNVYIGIFGRLVAIILPLVTIVITVLYSLRYNEPNNFIFKSIECVLLLFLVSGLVHIIQNTSGLAFSTSVVDAFNNAPTSFNGGFIGAVIGWVLLTLGKAPAIIISIVLIFVDIMFLFRITLLQFFEGASKPAIATYDAIEEHIEKRRMTKDNIDIPLDENPPEEIEKPKKQKRKAKDKKDAYKISIGEAEYNTDNIIEEINSAVKRRQAEELDIEVEPQTKSIDEIVRDASVQKEIVQNDDSLDLEKDKDNNDDNEDLSISYFLPKVNLLKVAKHAATKDVSGELKQNAEKLIETLHSFNVDATITDISRGPTVTRYELKPASGIRISKITNLADDIALNLAATHVRIEAPIPGKAAVGIEVPNTVKNAVSMRELIDTPEFDQQSSKLSAGLGKDIAGNCVYCDIAKMPHLLIAGTTGSGKSVCMNSIIVSILYRATPEEVKFLMIDPKQVEFSKYAGIPHLLVPVVTDPRKAAGALGWAVSEMLQRYNKFSETGVRDIEGYNKYVAKHEDENLEVMPKICIFIDELSDLMMAAPKEVEDSICRLAQMARAAGMHLIIATQRPSVDVITGLIKANISSRIALTVSSQIDSRTILDTGGAEKLLGRGDMLYNPIGASKPLRVQGCFISDEEVEDLCDYIKEQSKTDYDENIQKEIEAKAVQDKKSNPFEGDEMQEKHDVLFEKAAELVMETGTASTSFLQRKLSVGYARGAKIIDQLEEYGVIGPSEGSKPRQVIMDKQRWLEKRAYDSNKEYQSNDAQQITLDEAVVTEEIKDNQGDGDFYD